MAFDFGFSGNMKHYNQVRPELKHSCLWNKYTSYKGHVFCLRPWPQSTPPEYHVQNMKVPTALFSGGQDTLADPKDVAVLLTQVSPLLHSRTRFRMDVDYVSKSGLIQRMVTKTWDQTPGS